MIAERDFPVIVTAQYLLRTNLASSEYAKNTDDNNSPVIAKVLLIDPATLSTLWYATTTATGEIEIRGLENREYLPIGLWKDGADTFVAPTVSMTPLVLQYVGCFPKVRALIVPAATISEVV